MWCSFRWPAAQIPRPGKLTMFNVQSQDVNPARAGTFLARSSSTCLRFLLLQKSSFAKIFSPIIGVMNVLSNVVWSRPTRARIECSSSTGCRRCPSAEAQDKIVKNLRRLIVRRGNHRCRNKPCDRRCLIVSDNGTRFVKIHDFTTPAVSSTVPEQKRATGRWRRQPDSVPTSRAQ